MADFGRAYNRTMRNEGGYANNPKDRGGETYRGISRKNWPKWSGWRVIDNVKLTLTATTLTCKAGIEHLNGLLAAKSELQASVVAFYRENFWKRLGEIEDQRVAEETFDKAVNCGEVAYRWLQRAAGTPADGIVGGGTIKAVNAADPVTLLSGFNGQARHYYESIIERDPTQAVFKKSWFSRLRTYDDQQEVA